MIQAILESLLTKLASWFFAKVLAFIHGRQLKAKSDQEIDVKLAAVKQAYKEAFDGTPITEDQRKKLNQTIADFLSGNGTGL